MCLLIKKIVHHFFFGRFSLFLSSYLAKLNCLSAFFIAGFPAKSKPLGSLPSGDMFFNFNNVSDSSLQIMIDL